MCYNELIATGKSFRLQEINKKPEQLVQVIGI